MATFIVRGKLSLEGARGIVGKPEDRKAVVGKLFAAVGAKLTEYYITTGDKDFLIMIEADNVDTVAPAVMAASTSGAISDTETSRAWTSAEFISVAEKAGTVTGAYEAPGQG